MIRNTINFLAFTLLIACSDSNEIEIILDRPGIKSPATDIDSLRSQIDSIRHELDAHPNSRLYKNSKENLQMVDDILNDIEKRDEVLDSVISLYPNYVIPDSLR